MTARTKPVVRHLVPHALPSSIALTPPSLPTCPDGSSQPASIETPFAHGAWCSGSRLLARVLADSGVLRPQHRSGRVARFPVVALQADVDDLVAAHQ